MGMGERVTWRARYFGIWQSLTSEITAFDHLLRALPGGATEMTDRFRFAAPLPVLGWLAEHLFLRRYMMALLHERNVVVKQFAELR